MAINITNPETETAIRKLALLKGKGMTDVVHAAVTGALETLRRHRPAEDRLQAVHDRLAAARAVPTPAIDTGSALPKKPSTLFVDAAAITTMIEGGPDAAALARRLTRAARALSSPVAVLEACRLLMTRQGIDASAAAEVVATLFEEFAIGLMPLPSRAAQLALGLGAGGDLVAGLDAGAARYFRAPLLSAPEDEAA